MIPEIRQIKMNLTLFEQGVEEFMKKAEQVKNDNIELAKENASLKQRIAELEEKLKNK
jgi:regulator of replication initiation timing